MSTISTRSFTCQEEVTWELLLALEHQAFDLVAPVNWRYVRDEERASLTLTEHGDTYQEPSLFSMKAKHRLPPLPRQAIKFRLHATYNSGIADTLTITISTGMSLQVEVTGPNRNDVVGALAVLQAECSSPGEYGDPIPEYTEEQEREDKAQYAAVLAEYAESAREREPEPPPEPDKPSRIKRVLAAINRTPLAVQIVGGTIATLLGAALLAAAGFFIASLI